MALRTALHGALLEAVGSETLTLRCQVTGFEVVGGRVTVRAAGGETAEGDLLIGADGIGSVIRAGMHPHEPPPRSSRIGAVRGVVHGTAHHLGDRSGVMYLGRGVESFLVRASATGIYWALSLAQTVIPAGMDDPAAILAYMSPRMDATFRAVTAATEEMRYDGLVDRDPLPFWGRGPVTLLGDAAHPVLPHTGQGAAQALVDAVALGNALRDSVDLDRALRSYEADRRQKTTALLAQGRRTARVMRTTNPLACWMREAVIRAAPITPLVKVYARINRRAGTDVRH